MIDLMYHDVDRSRGLFYKLQQRDEMERTCTDDAITEAMTKPPETTRARLRGAFVKRCQGAPAGLHGGLGPPQAE